MERKVYQPGIYDITNEEYHKSAGISRSGLWELKKSPYHYQQRYLVDSPKSEPTPDMILGSLVHKMVLEYNKIWEDFVLKPDDINRRTNAGKIEYNLWLSANSSKMIITQEQYDLAHRMMDSVLSDKTANQLLGDCDMEKSIYFEHLGVTCKARPDAMKDGLLIDLKTTNDASYRSFQRSSVDCGYFLQAAMQKQALKALGHPFDNFIFIAVEKKPPFAVVIYIMDDEAIDFGEYQFNLLLQKYMQCYETNFWPSYTCKKLLIPSWAYTEMESENV